MSFLQSVSVQVTKTGEEGDSGMLGKKFTFVKADIMYANTNIGTITATLVNRQAIAENDFMATFDEQSSDLEWIGSALLENRRGRTRLQSLLEWDCDEFDFMYITSFTIQGDHDNNKNSDIATAALYHFLRDPQFIKGELQNGCWKVSSAVVVIPHFKEAVRKRKRDNDDENAILSSINAARHFVDPFLRNGFFQEPALIPEDPDNAKLLVASYGHWNKPNPKTQAEVSTIRLIAAPAIKPTGKDKDILEAVQAVCDSHPHTVNLAAVMSGTQRYQPPTDQTTEEQLATLKSTIDRLVREGGSLVGSTSLHAACEENKPKIVAFLLDRATAQKSALINSQNPLGQTPLMVAAQSASGRLNINGIDDTLVIDKLLGDGANKSTTDSTGRTAYGHFRKMSQSYMGLVVPTCRGKLVALESKLCPPGGPTVVDLATNGNRPGSGFVDYGPEDDEADREMGRGRYANNSDDDGDDGDY